MSDEVEIDDADLLPAPKRRKRKLNFDLEEYMKARGIDDEGRKEMQKRMKELEAEVAKVTKGEVRDANFGTLSHLGDIRPEIKSEEIAPGAVVENQEPDWETIFRNCDGGKAESTENAMGDDSKRLANAMSAKLLSLLGDWLIHKPNSLGKASLESIGRRAVAGFWVIDPERFGSVSLLEISKRLEYKGANSISPDAAEFSRTFGISNHFQRSHNWRNN